MTPMRWFYSFVKKYIFRICIGLFMTACVALLSVFTPYISGKIVDDVIKGQNHEILPALLAVLIGATLIRGLVRAGYLMLFESTSQSVLYDMRSFLYKCLMEKDFNFYNKHRTGEIMSRQTGDMDAIRHFLAHSLYYTWLNVLMFTVSLFMIFTVNWKLALCMLVVLPLTFLSAYKQSKSIHPAFQNIRQQFSSLNAFAQENIGGNRVVKAFAKEDFELEKFRKENKAYQEAELKAAKIWSIYIPIFEFLSSFLMIILMLVGGIMVIRGEMSIGQMITVDGYLWMLNNPLKQASYMINDLHRMIASVERVYATVQEEAEVREPEHPVAKEELKGEIAFRDVSYTANESDIIQNVNFTVKPGETVGIIGATGSGKSTIMNLLCRFYDVTEGEVCIDGVNVKDYSLPCLRGHIGMAMQDVFLFSDTIKANIAYSQPGIGFEAIEHVAKVANADGFIRETPDGYNTIIGERGMGLSGGQKQRISLARALLKNPSILILDDTTSAVDMETESQIQEELSGLHGRATIFIIAHRISSIKDADRILVLNKGRIMEEGNHDSLIEKDGYYAQVYKHQYGEFDHF